MTRRLNAFLGALLVIIGVPFYWYFINSGSGAAEPKPITMSRLRSLADEIAGPVPVDIRYETITMRFIGANFVDAGSGLRFVPYPMRVYQLRYADGSWTTIDSGPSPEIARQFDFRRIKPDTAQSLKRLLAGSRAQLYLSRFPVHSGMHVVPQATDSGSPATATSPQPSTRPAAVAPGIVAIPATGLPYRQTLYFVKLVDGREYLFAGDVAHVAANWKEGRLPARIVTSFYRPADRETLATWLHTIRSLKSQDRALQVIEGHTNKEITGVHAGFDFDAPAKQATGNGQAVAVRARDGSR